MVSATKLPLTRNDQADFYSSDEDSSKQFALKNTKKAFDIYGKDNDTDDENEDITNKSGDSEDEDDEVGPSKKKSTKTFIEKAQENNESDNDDDDDDDDNADEKTNYEDDEDQYYGFVGDSEDDELVNDEALSDPKLEETAKFLEKNINGTTTFGTKKIKKLTTKQLEKEENRIKKTGVVYLSSLPPYMKPQKLRQVMSRFGEVGRIFLKPEDPKVYKSRIKSGGNKKKKFDEGWVEFAKKGDAKLAASTLNGNVLGGKKRSFYHDDVMNVKYLKGFKWFDLTNALNREVEVRESKKQAELSQANKLNKAYIKNVETSKTINRVKESKKRKLPKDSEDSELKDEGIRRNFKQRNVATNRAGADESIKNKKGTNLNGVLNKIF